MKKLIYIVVSCICNLVYAHEKQIYNFLGYNSWKHYAPSVDREYPGTLCTRSFFYDGKYYTIEENGCFYLKIDDKDVDSLISLDVIEENQTLKIFVNESAIFSSDFEFIRQGDNFNVVIKGDDSERLS